MKALYLKNDKNRVVQTRELDHRSAFRRDNGRLLHSAVFRRLQGKTQLFPNDESDFFRNRLTHSLEVAQIAKGIAENFNASVGYFRKNNIDTDLVETAALAHDLGHPPFGHNGEKALDICMKMYGGFEGNAQTLRILSRLEKKSTLKADNIPIKKGIDQRCGLNLSFRTLAAILKYDHEIPIHRPNAKKPIKGYYYTEKEIVEKIKKNVLNKHQNKKLKTIECQIMDIADDIAYSTYDLEDAFKAGFLSPLDMLSMEPEFIDRIAEKVNEGLEGQTITSNEVRETLGVLFEHFGTDVLQELSDMIQTQRVNDQIRPEEIKPAIRYASSYAYDLSNRICKDGYLRTQLTSALVRQFMAGVEIEYIDEESPALSKVCLSSETRKRVEILKRLNFISVIDSPRLKIAEFRGYDIVEEIFNTLVNDDRKGYNLLPDDFRALYNGFSDEGLKKRVVCDFIAGMTDQYAVEFYARLKSENPQTIFKPF